MSLYKYPFWEVLMHSFSKEVWEQVLPALGETMYMVVISSVFVLLFGVILGLVVVLTGNEGLFPCAPLHAVLGAIINCFRSLPQVIIIIVMLPVARLLLGQSYGSNACTNQCAFSAARNATNDRTGCGANAKVFFC